MKRIGSLVNELLVVGIVSAICMMVAIMMGV